MNAGVHIAQKMEVHIPVVAYIGAGNQLRSSVEEQYILSAVVLSLQSEKWLLPELSFVWFVLFSFFKCFI